MARLQYDPSHPLALTTGAVGLLLFFVAIGFALNSFGEGNDDPPDHVVECGSYARQTGRDVMLEDLDLTTASAVAADDGGGLWMLTETEVLHADDGRVDLTLRVPGASLATGPRGRVAVSTSSTSIDAAIIVFGTDPAADCTTALALPQDSRINDVTITDDSTVLVSYSDADFIEGRIVALEPDGDVRSVVGLADADTESDVEVEEPLSAISSLVALPNDRVAFVTAGDGVLHLLDNGEIRTIDAPVDSSRTLRLTGPAPGGRLLAIAARAETHPQIQVIDVDTGQTDTVTDLEGVEEGDVDATAVGDDVVYLANGRLWRLASVFD